MGNFSALSNKFLERRTGSITTSSKMGPSTAKFFTKAVLNGVDHGE